MYIGFWLKRFVCKCMCIGFCFAPPRSASPHTFPHPALTTPLTPTNPSKVSPCESISFLFGGPNDNDTPSQLVPELAPQRAFSTSKGS